MQGFSERMNTAADALVNAVEGAALSGFRRARVLGAVEGGNVSTPAGVHVGPLFAVYEAARVAAEFHLKPGPLAARAFDSIENELAGVVSITAQQINALHFYSLAISDASRAGVSAVDIQTLSRGGNAGPGGSTCEFVWETAQGLIDAGLDVEAVMDALT